MAKIGCVSVSNRCASSCAVSATLPKRARTPRTTSCAQNAAEDAANRRNEPNHSEKTCKQAMKRDRTISASDAIEELQHLRCGRVLRCRGDSRVGLVRDAQHVPQQILQRSTTVQTANRDIRKKVRKLGENEVRRKIRNSASEVKESHNSPHLPEQQVSNAIDWCPVNVNRRRLTRIWRIRR